LKSKRTHEKAALPAAFRAFFQHNETWFEFSRICFYKFKEKLFNQFFFHRRDADGGLRKA
jgi:hypothetical protein